MLRRTVVVVAIVLPLAIAACGDDDEEEGAASPPPLTEESPEATAPSGGGETVAIAETEFALDPAEATVKAGTVTFEITNDGNTVHNLEVEGDGVEEVSEDISPGDSTELAVDLAAGTYEMYCAIGDHKEQGMEGELTVQ